MYSNSTTENAPPPDTAKYLRLGIVVAIGLVIFAIVGSQGVILSMNFTEFEDKFTKPLYYSVISAIILCAIVLVRVNIVGRSSIFWYGVNTAISFLNKGGRDPIANNISRFQDYKLSSPQFVIWQITKILLFGAFFSNVMFGFAAVAFFDGNDFGVENLPTLFTLPFVTPPTDPSYATEKVVPMIPALLILIPPLLAAIGLRLALYVGLHSVIKVVTSYIHDSSEGKPRYLNYVSTMEAVIGIGVLWGAFTFFFTADIDYNTRYAIAGTLVIGFALIAFSFVDRIRARILTHMLKRDVYIRILTVIAIAIIVGGLMSVNDSIADARKIEYLGPYTAQQIGVNRYLGELDKIVENTHNVKLQSISPNNIENFIKQNNDVLDVIRVWDWEAAFAKLKPEIGLIPYVDFEDNDILRFNNTLYWTASMKPVLPSSVATGDRWYNEHLVYTHVPNGFLILEATDGLIVDSSKFFKQRAIYYGEGGLLEQTWSGYPVNRGDESDELLEAFYNGEGGLTLSPPISWVFEPNFMLSFPTEPVHVMRYKDIEERMQILYPYFLYHLFGSELDSLPVTDGKNSYWLMPLMAGFDTSDVPWSAGNPYIRLVGYALLDTYDGSITLLQVGDDFFTEMFVSQYSDQFIPMPTWLEEQIRYPAELFDWRTEMYNIYHVTDVDTFIQANQFYEIPRGLETYFIEAKPPGFDQTEYIGLLSLELRGSQGRNLAGFMIVENDLPNLGKLQFYEVPLNSTTKLIGPTAVREALDRDPDFAQLKTLLRNPRIGDNILYQVGGHDTYFIPVYTAGAGGVVAQLGTIAAVGAAFTGEYYVGLGDTQEEAFEAYLQKLSGVATTPTTTNGEITELSKADRIETIKSIFIEHEIEILEPTSIQIPLSFKEGEIVFFTEREQEDTEKLISEFIDDFVKPRSDRIFLWEDDNVLNFGTIIVRDGVPEIHYIAIEVGI
ncbi:MAG: conserved membrane protein of unknown function [Nitrosopumilales archaeon]|nr:MAG: conserved membrane protein of unknown function [Nitrosopumilales archaeon]